MRIVRLTLTASFAMLLISAAVVTQAQTISPNGPVSAVPVSTPNESADGKLLLACYPGAVADDGCNNGNAKCSNPNCSKCRTFCSKHGKDCRHNCLNKNYGYGQMDRCPPKGHNGPCPIHGYGPCPDPRAGFAPAMREALRPADHPYFGMQPIYTPRSYYGDYQPRFPKLHSWFCPPVYNSTKPVEPMPTYTTRGPRDFLNPNPPSIGY